MTAPIAITANNAKSGRGLANLDSVNAMADVTIAEAGCLPALPDPASPPELLARACVDLADRVALVSDIDEGLDLLAQVAAIEEFLSHQRTDTGPVKTAARLLEARIGDLIGPAINGGDHRSDHQVPREVPDDRLSKNRRYDFRLMAEYRLAWEARLPCSRSEAVRLAREAKTVAENTDQPEPEPIQAVDSGRCAAKRHPALKGRPAGEDLTTLLVRVIDNFVDTANFEYSFIRDAIAEADPTRIAGRLPELKQALASARQFYRELNRLVTER